MKSALLSLVVILSFSMVSCLKNSVVVPSGHQSRSGLWIGLSMKDAPLDVASIVGLLSRQGYQTDTSAFVISNDSATCTFSNVAVGNWFLRVNAYDLSDSLKYTGSASVQVIAGEVTPVSLTLSPATDSVGSIGITVTWSGQDTTSTDMALKFDGINGRVDFSPSASLQPQSMTVELRVLFDTLSQFQPILVDRVGDLWNQASGFEITYENGFLYFQLAQSSIYRAGPRYLYTPLLHEWVNIACTYDGDSIKIYVNGQLVVRQAYSTSVFYADNIGLSMGYAYNSYYGGHNYFKGAMDELRIWNYARTEEMVDSSMDSKLTGKEPGLVGYWDFNRNSSDTYAIDRTGNGNNGQLIGGVQFVPVSSLSVLTGIDKLHR